MKSSPSIKWFLCLIVGASLVTFTMTGCEKKGPVEEAADDAAAAVEDAAEAVQEAAE